ncbi:Predicted Kef-type K+ transport protein, K+/H+ antiporter domain [Cyclobacterium lianum]|uniref:Predicted Kef-type K+ transport protein, K+/H+ antiporter domain n=1 Tax=Cyclobacterium lianum TaxID=388280 RepID=A0A1M7P7B4_9BACT|nr:cation:proton antiporter [Cyclobacterium lianum]SHN12562.1 Predicted Kef-type K+ transport protein, K+/H+ antiporter domain [Cyclobacterium lianum]
MNWLGELAANPFYEFAIILFLAALLGGAGQLLRQPLIVMFIALGILVGPSVLDVVYSKENIHLLAEVGIVILLFIVGLKLDLRIIKSVGRVALLTGLGQVLFTSFIGYLIGIGMGFSHIHSFYVAVALTFSSTIIIVKLLSDKKEIDSLHGQIAVGFLIVQDIVVILVMIVLSTMRQETESPLWQAILQTVLSGAVLLLLTWLAMKWLIPGLSNFLARSQELLVLFAIAWAVSLASLGEVMGFSGEVGAFLAGVSLASSSFKEAISSRLVSLRDFLLLFFFVNLGAELNFDVIGNQVGTAFVFSFFVLIGNPIIVLIIMGIMGYKKRTSFLAGLTVAQISEFSLIFAGLGLSIGHINEEVVGLITLVGLITIGLSTYLILYSHPLYEFLSPLLRIFERRKIIDPFIEDKSDKAYDLIILGFGRFGSKIADILDQQKEFRYLGIDFDPMVVRQEREAGRDVVFADMEDPEIFHQIPFKTAKCVISTVPLLDPSRHLVETLVNNGYAGKIYLTALRAGDLALFEKSGADKVLIPHHMAATHFYESYLRKQLSDRSK